MNIQLDFYINLQEFIDKLEENEKKHFETIQNTLSE